MQRLKVQRQAFSLFLECPPSVSPALFFVERTLNVCQNEGLFFILQVILLACCLLEGAPRPSKEPKAEERCNADDGLSPAKPPTAICL